MHLESESTENQLFAQWLLEVGNEARILTEDYAGNLTFIPRISLTFSTFELLFIFRQHQFPIQLAFAMTINKSQDQSVKHVDLDLRTPVFSHGQLYVALSRCTAPN
ncbi:41488_t:CDS:2, partial [Gigaspora margarita]